MTEFMTYRPYTQMELVDLGKKFQQMQGGPLLAWLLQLWDTGVGPAPMGFLRVLTERSRGMHVRCHFESVKTLEGDLSWQGCPNNPNRCWSHLD